MYKKNTTVKNPTGLHARPASEFINVAGKFDAKILIKRTEDEAGEEEANAKSIVNLLALGFCQGEDITITANGEDEQQAVDSLLALIDGGFGEL